MSEHLPSTMIGQMVMAYCPVCKRHTKHRVDRVAVGPSAGKIGTCQVPHRKLNSRGETKKQERTRQEQERLRRQPSLFGGDRGQ